MAENALANPASVRRFVKSTAPRSGLHAPGAQVCRVFGWFLFFQITVQSKPIVHRLILRVVPSVKFIKLFLRWLLVIKETDGKFSVRFKQYLKDENGVLRKGKPISVLNGPFTQEGTEEIYELFDKPVFDFPKPSRLIKYLFSAVINENDSKDGIYLDFFGGSATSVQAIFELNRDDGGNRKFIVVQIDENTNPKKEGHKAGFNKISEITAERIRRAAKKIEAEIDAGLPLEQKPDLGFKFYRLERSNFKAWSDYQGTSLDELRGLLQAQVSTAFVDGATKEGILTEILLLEGFPLDSDVEPDATFERNEVLRVSSDANEHRLFVTLDEEIWEETISNAEELESNDIFICLDKALSDESKIRLSDVCRLKVI